MSGREENKPPIVPIVIALIGLCSTVTVAIIGFIQFWLPYQENIKSTQTEISLTISASVPFSQPITATPPPSIPPQITEIPPQVFTTVPTSTFTQLPTLTPTPTQIPTSTPTIEPSVGSEEWRQRLLPLKDGTISSVLTVGQFRRQSDLIGMSLDDQRNILIVELAGRTNQSGGYYQSLDNDTLAGAGAMLVFVRAAKIRTDETLKTLTDDDIRNIFIVEIYGRTGRTDLQGLSNIQLVQLALSLQW
jgi:hypothetical protein